MILNRIEGYVPFKLNVFSYFIEIYLIIINLIVRSNVDGYVFHNKVYRRCLKVLKKSKQVYFVIGKIIIYEGYSIIYYHLDIPS